jgi:hypothetical protein
MSQKMKTKLLSILIVCLAMLVIIPGCSKTTPLTTASTTSTTVVQNPGPWQGVPVYQDSNSPIKTRVNETFSIVLPPAALFGWGWQNSDLKAFTLLETKTAPGPGNETNPYGPNAFLFKALQSGTFQIVLYVASKPPQQTETFNVVVNP